MCSIFSCSDKGCISYDEDSYQIDGAFGGCINEPNFFVDIDTVDFGDFIDARLYSVDDDVRFVKAYVDSTLSDICLIDTSKQSVVGAKLNLHMDKDTIRVYFKPRKRGTFNFMKTKILYFKKDLGFAVLDTSFQFTTR